MPVLSLGVAQAKHRLFGSLIRPCKEACFGGSLQIHLLCIVRGRIWPDLEAPLSLLLVRCVGGAAIRGGAKLRLILGSSVEAIFALALCRVSYIELL